MKETLEYKNGWLCLASTQADYAQPIMRTLYFPIYPCTAVEAATWPIGEPVKSWLGGLFVYSAGGRETRLELKDGSSTKPMCNEEVPIPAPRAKQTRWHDGRWEKNTKAKGWQSA